PVGGVVAAEGVHGEQRAQLGDVGVHAVRPVEEGHAQKAEGAPAQVDGLPVLHGAGGEGLVHDLLQKGDGGGAAHHGGVRGQIQQLFQAAGVVGFGVAHNDVAHLVQAAYLFEVGQIFVEEFLLHRFEQ